jgi:hypothetical protein
MLELLELRYLVHPWDRRLSSLLLHCHGRRSVSILNCCLKIEICSMRQLPSSNGDRVCANKCVSSCCCVDNFDFSRRYQDACQGLRLSLFCLEVHSLWQLLAIMDCGKQRVTNVSTKSYDNVFNTSVDEHSRDCVPRSWIFDP